MALAQDKNLRSAEQFARQLFLEQPGLGIDDAARIIADSCDRGLVKNAISDIRRQVRQTIAHQGSKGVFAVPPVVRKPTQAPFNPIRVTPAAPVVEPPPEVKEESVAKPAEKPKPASAEVRASKSDRLAFLESWALENPLGTIEQARRAVADGFGGISLGTAIISQTMRTAKELWENQRKAVQAGQPAPVPVVAQPAPDAAVQTMQQQIASWAKAMKTAGIRSLALNDDGTVRVEFAQA